MNSALSENGGLFQFVTGLTHVTTAACPPSSTSFVSEHIRGDVVLKSVTVDQQRKNGIHFLWSKGGVARRESKFSSSLLFYGS